MTNPLVSVILPVYNAQDYIAEAIGSILDQRYEPLEIIVIDDGSTDETAKRLSAFKDRILYRYQENKGPAAARNHGMRLAKGAVFAFADADDLWPEGKLSRQLEHLYREAETEVVIGRQKIEYLPDALERKKGLELLKEPVVCQGMPMALARRSAFDKIGLFDETLIYAEDLDWFLRARELGVKVVAYDEVANISRRHASNMTHDIAKMRHYTFKMFQKSLQRRRNNPELNYTFSTLSEAERRSDAK